MSGKTIRSWNAIAAFMSVGCRHADLASATQEQAQRVSRTSKMPAPRDEAVRRLSTRSSPACSTRTRHLGGLGVFMGMRIPIKSDLFLLGRVHSSDHLPAAQVGGSE